MTTARTKGLLFPLINLFNPELVKLDGNLLVIQFTLHGAVITEIDIPNLEMVI